MEKSNNRKKASGGSGSSSKPGAQQRQAPAQTQAASAKTFEKWFSEGMLNQGKGERYSDFGTVEPTKALKYYQMAADCFKNAVHLEPASTEALYHWAHNLLKQAEFTESPRKKDGFLVEAAKVYDELLFRGGSSGDVLFNYGQLLVSRAEICRQSQQDAAARKLYLDACEKYASTYDAQTKQLSSVTEGKDGSSSGASAPPVPASDPPSATSTESTANAAIASTTSALLEAKPFNLRSLLVAANADSSADEGDDGTFQASAQDVLDTVLEWTNALREAANLSACLADSEQSFEKARHVLETALGLPLLSAFRLDIQLQLSDVLLSKAEQTETVPSRPLGERSALYSRASDLLRQALGSAKTVDKAKGLDVFGKLGEVLVLHASALQGPETENTDAGEDRAIALANEGIGQLLIATEQATPTTTGIDLAPRKGAAAAKEEEEEEERLLEKKAEWFALLGDAHLLVSRQAASEAMRKQGLCESATSYSQSLLLQGVEVKRTAPKGKGKKPTKGGGSDDDEDDEDDYEDVSTTLFNLACVHALLGNEEDCQAALETAQRKGVLVAEDLGSDKDLAVFAGKPWFEQLRKR